MVPPHNSSVPVPDWVVGYMADRDRERAEQRREAFAKLTEREQRIAHEFAVMGFVCGTNYHLRPDEQFPRDAAIMALVLDGLLSNAGQAMATFRAIAGIEPS